MWHLCPHRRGDKYLATCKAVANVPILLFIREKSMEGTTAEKTINKLAEKQKNKKGYPPSRQPYTISVEPFLKLLTITSTLTK